MRVRSPWSFDGAPRRSLTPMLVPAVCLAVFACRPGAPDPASPVAASAVDPAASHVLVVANRQDAESTRLAGYYAQRRHIPTANIVLVSTTSSEEITKAKFGEEIQGPIRSALAGKAIDYIVLMRGVPIRFSDWGQSGGYSVDAVLAADKLPIEPITALDEGQIRRSINPYFGKGERFSHARYGMYLVTRLDGYTLSDAMRLVDDSVAAKPNKGPFFFDEAGNRREGDYLQMQQTLDRANGVLKTKGLQSALDTTDAFVAPSEPLAGYASWGSNDSAFNVGTYKKLRFLPGALVETFVSTSGRTFRPTTGGQSLIADLIANGVTGVKGYVSEPYTFALARPDILFDRYTAGFNLAESFYMASPIAKWKDVVIGDPLCNPYAK